jgi:hypothetical protein
MDAQNTVVVYNVLIPLRDEPSSARYTSQVLQQNIDEEVRYTTIEEEWNEYITEQGGRIRIKLTVMGGACTTFKDRKGGPIYFVETSQIVQGQRPGTATTA